MDDTLERLLRFQELGKVADRISDEVLAEVRAMSPTTIDRYLAPIGAARYPQAKSTTRPGLVLRASIPLRTAMDGFPATPGYLRATRSRTAGTATPATTWSPSTPPTRTWAGA